MRERGTEEEERAKGGRKGGNEGDREYTGVSGLFPAFQYSSRPGPIGDRIVSVN